MTSPRKRRSPDEARREILDAAQRLLAAHGPDAIGLKDVAREAGVSHALVSHYFGTYDALVEAALRDHLLAMRAETLSKIPEVLGGGPEAWVDLCFEQLSRPLTGRLIAWSILSGRMDSDDFFPRRDQGMKVVADAIEARLAMTGVRPMPTREDIELAMLLVFSTVLGYGVARSVLWDSLSRPVTAERDRAFRQRLAALIAEMPAAKALAPAPAGEKRGPRRARR